MSAREIIARGIAKETGSSLAWTRADAALNALTAAGYRILAPGELAEISNKIKHIRTAVKEDDIV